MHGSVGKLSQDNFIENMWIIWLDILSGHVGQLQRRRQKFKLSVTFVKDCQR